MNARRSRFPSARNRSIRWIRATGEILPVCIEFSKTPDADTWHAYKRVGFDGEISKFDSGGFDKAGQAVAKDSNFPTRGGSICYLLQFFDKDGNASPIVPVDWVQRASKVPLPRPSIVACTRVGDEQQDLTAFCPREGVERLEWKICPAPPGAANTTTEAFLDNGVVKFVTCAFIDSPRLESDYQSDASQFVQRFDLFKGTALPRARQGGRYGAAEEREFGLWSEEKVITWPIEAPLDGPKGAVASPGGSWRISPQGTRRVRQHEPAPVRPHRDDPPRRRRGHPNR